MIFVLRVKQWFVKLAMEMSSPSPEEVSKPCSFYCSYCFIVVTAVIRLACAMPEGAKRCLRDARRSGVQELGA